MQRPRPFFNNMMKNHKDQFNPFHNQNYRFPTNPAPQYMQRPPFNRNRAPYVQNFNEDHWCETCDRGFNTLEILEKHKQQHQKCNIDGCQFIAHPKVITKHIQMQHASGLYKKIAKLNNPEEIQKWREERKKRFPTKANIEKKAAEIKEKIDRGEKMGLNKEGHRRQFNKGNHPNKKFLNENNQQNRNRQRAKPNNASTFNKIKKPVHIKKVNNVLPPSEIQRKLKPFAGIQDIVMETNFEEPLENTNCNFVIDDDDCEEVPKPAQVAVNDSEPKVCGALSSLICHYDFSDEENNDSVQDESNAPNKPQEIKNQAPITISKPLTTTKMDEVKNQHDDKSDDDAPEEIKIDKPPEAHTVEEPPKIGDSIKMKKKVFIDKKPNRNHFTKPKYKVPSTLLHKLLRREVQHERNIVLQCVRHIVKNNFFDKQ